MNTYELDINELSPGALATLRAAIKHARSNQPAQRHVMSLENFYAVTGLSKSTPQLELKGLLIEVKRTPLFSHDLDAGKLAASLAFESIELTEKGLEFSVSPGALDASEPQEVQNDRSMLQLNEALAMALENAEGDPQAFAFYLSAALAGFMGQRMLNEHVAMQSIRLLHQLHPSISV